MPGPRPRNRRSGLAGVGGLQRSSRLFLALVRGAVAHQGHLVRCRLLARDGALFAAGSLDNVVLGRERRRGDNQRKRRDSQFEFHDLVSFDVVPHIENRSAGFAGGRFFLILSAPSSICSLSLHEVLPNMPVSLMLPPP